MIYYKGEVDSILPSFPRFHTEELSLLRACNISNDTKSITEFLLGGY